MTYFMKMKATSLFCKYEKLNLRTKVIEVALVVTKPSNSCGGNKSQTTRSEDTSLKVMKWPRLDVELSGFKSFKKKILV